MALAPQAARLNKQALRTLALQPLPSGVSGQDGGAQASVAYGYADSTEHREGIGAFLEKRKPVF
jgi:enoyl-CoA hydratase/carnithine racemase